MKNLINTNEGSAKIINNLYKDWQGINSESGQKYWSKLIKNQKFGTYEQYSILDVLPGFICDWPNEVIKRNFINEVKNALK